MEAKSIHFIPGGGFQIVSGGGYVEVLGTSSTVTVTITVSSFLPTDTPTPTPTNTPSPTPTPTPTPTSSGGSGSPTNTPTPTGTPSPTPTPTPTPTSSGGLLATIAGSGTTTTESVDEVVIEGAGEESDIVIVPAGDGDQMVIEQGNTQVETELPVQIDAEDQKLKVGTKEGYRQIISPEEAMEKLIKNGTFLTPKGLKLGLVNENGKVVYRISGHVNVRILNLFTVKFPSFTDINAYDGKIVRVKDSLAVRMLKFLRIGKVILK